MLCKTYCATCIGITAVTVTVEVDLSNGIGIHLVGLPDNAVKSLLRVTTALQLTDTGSRTQTGIQSRTRRYS